MKLPAFCILTLLSLIYAGLTLQESMVYRAWDKSLADQKGIQMKIAYFQQLDVFTKQLLQRMVIESQRDPAIGDLLKENKLKVVITHPESANIPSTSIEAATNAAPVPQAPTPSHP